MSKPQKRNYTEDQTTLYLIIRMIKSTSEWLDEYIQRQRRAEAFGSLLDPTAYIQNADKFDQDCIAARIISEAVTRIEKEFSSVSTEAEK